MLLHRNSHPGSRVSCLAMVALVSCSLVGAEPTGTPVRSEDPGSSRPVASAGTRLREQLSSALKAEDPVASLFRIPGAQGRSIEETRLFLAVAVALGRDLDRVRRHLDDLEREYCDSRGPEDRASTASWSAARLDQALELLGTSLEAHHALRLKKEEAAEMERLLPRLEEERAAFRREVLETLPGLSELFAKDCGWLGPCKKPSRTEITMAAVTAMMKNPGRVLKVVPLLSRWRRIQGASMTALTRLRLEVVGAQQAVAKLPGLDLFAPLAPCRWR